MRLLDLFCGAGRRELFRLLRRECRQLPRFASLFSFFIGSLLILCVPRRMWRFFVLLRQVEIQSTILVPSTKKEKKPHARQDTTFDAFS